jgi:hypothetical protein
MESQSQECLWAGNICQTGMSLSWGAGEAEMSVDYGGSSSQGCYKVKGLMKPALSTSLCPYCVMCRHCTRDVCASGVSERNWHLSVFACMTIDINPPSSWALSLILNYIWPTLGSVNPP